MRSIEAVRLAEGLEGAPQQLGVHADTRVRDGEHDGTPVARAEAHRHRAPRGCELARVVQQVADHLHEAPGVATHGEGPRGELRRQPQPCRLDAGPGSPPPPRATISAKSQRCALQHEPAHHDARDVEQVVDQPRQVAHLAVDHLERVRAGPVERAGHAEDLRRVANRPERVAQLVAEHREEGVLVEQLALARGRGRVVHAVQVDAADRPVRHAARAVAQREAPAEVGAIATVVPPQPDALDLERPVAGAPGQPRGQGALDVLAMDDALDLGTIESAVQLTAEELHAAGVRVLDETLRVDQDHSDGQPVDERVEAPVERLPGSALRLRHRGWIPSCLAHCAPLPAGRARPAPRFQYSGAPAARASEPRPAGARS